MTIINALNQPYIALNKAGDTMTGPLDLYGDATTSLEPVTYQQLLAQIAALNAGFVYKGVSYVATTTNLSATYNNGSSGVGATLTFANNLWSIDGVAQASIPPNSQILVKDQSTQPQNGFYIKTSDTVLTRATNYDSSSTILAGTWSNVTNGATNVDSIWQMVSAGTITVGTTNIVFDPVPKLNVTSPLQYTTPNTITLNQALIAIASSQITDKNSANGVAGLDAGAHLLAALFPALTGDVTTASGSLATTLATVNSNPNTFGDASHSLQATVNAKGLIPALSAIAIAIASSQITDKAAANGVASLDSGTHLPATQFPAVTGDISISAGTTSATLPNIVTAATNPKITYNAKGQVTAGAALVKTDIPNIDESQVTNLVTDLANKQPLAANLTGLAALAVLGMVTMTAAGGFAARQLTSSSGQITFTNPDAVLGNPDLALNLSAIRWQPITQATTSRTLSLTDVNVTISCFAGGGDTTITVPTNASVAIPIGAQVKIINGAGGSLVTNVVAAGGVTFSPFTSLVLGSGGYAVLEKIGANNWLILEHYEQYTITTNWTGIWASNQSGNITCSAIGGSVNLSIPQVLATGNTNASFITAVTNLPSYLAPPFEIIQYIPIVNNAANAQGAIVIESTGSITIYAGAPNFSNFTANGVNAGFKGFNVSYAI